MTQHLPIGYSVKNHDHSGVYTIQKVLGCGASTVAYLTIYTDSSGRVSERILKEFCPSTMHLSRNSDGAISTAEKDRDNFAQGMVCFSAGGDRQNDLRMRTHLTNETPPLQTTFYANNTCYLEVTPFEGKTYSHIEDFSLIERIKLCLAVAKLIRRYHDEGLLYLDLKPENIFVLTNSSGETVTDLVELIDFDSVMERDKIFFGNSLSYTEAWGAPEQCNPYSYRKISEATDIYAIGELVFWSVFGRHSTVEEHRSFSQYPFDDENCIFYDDLNRQSVQQALSTLFARTIRSSVQNRFASMEDVVAALNKVVAELEKKQFIIPSKINVNHYFAGRDYELHMLDELLSTNNLVMVSGIAGIGKSELVKQYIHNADFSDVLYWVYDGNLETMICDENSVSINNFSRYAKESDADYARRKLSKIKALISKRDLIYIDNLDVLVDELLPSDIWQFLLSMPAKIIISTRCNERHYAQLKVNEINDSDVLRQIFYNSCPSCGSCAEQLPFVDRIISIAQKHTYEIILLAAYTESKMQTPEDTLCQMDAVGFSGFDNTELSAYKDGVAPSATFSNHLKKLFAMSSISEKQEALLLRLAFLPATGICAKDICAFYSFRDMTDLNWLVAHGFVFLSQDNTHTVSIHPSIADVAIGAVEKYNGAAWEAFYSDALIAMRKGYDDESVNQAYYIRACQTVEHLNIKDLVKKQHKEMTHEEIQTVKESVRREFEKLYAKSTVSPYAYAALCTAIAEKTVICKADHILSAKYLVQYVEWFSKYGRSSLLEMLIDYALSLYDKNNPGLYIPDREYAYAAYADLLFAQGMNSAKLATICTERLRVARKAKDWNMASYWCTNLAKCNYLMRDTDFVSYQARGAYYSAKNLLESKKRRAKYSHSFSESLAKNDIRTAELQESVYDIYPPSDCATTIWNLRLAIKYRKKAESNNSFGIPSDNCIRIAIDEARIHRLNHNYRQARTVLCSSLEPFRTGEHMLTIAILDAFIFLGDLFVAERYADEATDAYNAALYVAESLNIGESLQIKVKIGRAMNIAQKFQESVVYNENILNKLKEASTPSNQHILADAYYNAGIANSLAGEYGIAQEQLNSALANYNEANRLRLHTGVGTARCYEALAHISMIQSDRGKACELMRKAITLLEELQGTDDPEVRTFKRTLQQYYS